MKFLILVPLIISINNSYACEKIINSEYKFGYEIKNDNFIYNLKRKDNKNFLYYNKSYQNIPGHIGFIIERSNFKKVFKSSMPLENLTKEQKLGIDFTNFYWEDGQLNSSMFYKLVNSYNTPPSKENYLPLDYFINSSEINQSINLTKIFGFFKESLPEEERYGRKKIKIKVKLVLDSNLKECIVFETSAFPYNFGDKSWYKFKKFFK